MANPVMNSIVKDWSTQQTTPAGYPAMPGYQPASQQAQNPYGGSTNPYAQGGADAQYGYATGSTEYAAQNTYPAPQGAPVYGLPQDQQGGYETSMDSYEAMLNAPAADAVDRGAMTYDDVVVKSLMCFGLLLVGAVAGWMTGVVALSAAMLVAFAACAVTLGLALFIQFSKKVRPGAIVVYSLVEGFVLGALSCAFEMLYPGIVVSAVLATLVVIGVTLGAFTMGFVRNSNTLTRVAGIGSLLLNPNAKKVRITLQALNDTDFVLETDSPFMLGHETNTPANIRRIAEIAAELRNVPLAQLAEITEQNVDSLLHTSP